MKWVLGFALLEVVFVWGWNRMIKLRDKAWEEWEHKSND